MRRFTDDGHLVCQLCRYGREYLDYEVKGFTRSDKEDACGVMHLTVPASWLKPGEPVELKVVGSAAGSKRFFGIYDYGQ